MSDYIDDLVDSLSDEQVVELIARTPGRRAKVRRYRPIYPESLHEKMSLGEEFIRKLEEEGDEKEVFKKYVRKGTRQPGTEKKKIEAYLRRALERAAEEGRI